MSSTTRVNRTVYASRVSSHALVGTDFANRCLIHATEVSWSASSCKLPLLNACVISHRWFQAVVFQSLLVFGSDTSSARRIEPLSAISPDGIWFARSSLESDVNGCPDFADLPSPGANLLRPCVEGLEGRPALPLFSTFLSTAAWALALALAAAPRLCFGAILSQIWPRNYNHGPAPV